MTNVCIAVCQIESHPALYVGSATAMEEPFVVGPDKASLAKLRMHGFQVEDLQNLCRTEYMNWSERRIRQIITYLDQVEPSPDLVLFPEGSLPLQCLAPLADWSGKSGATILAGSHSPVFGKKGRRYYEELRISNSELDTLRKRSCCNVLPLMRMGRTSLIPKTLYAHVEKSEVSTPDPAWPALKPYSLRKSGVNVSILPLICSEALQSHNVTKSYEIAAIVSYAPKPNYFDNYIALEVNNQRIVALCNDAAVGGSFVYTAEDTRASDWLPQAMPSGLPRGEGILIVQVDLEARSVQVGTATPRRPYRLVRLASITYEDGGHFELSQELARVRDLPDPSSRSAELQKIIGRKQAGKLQQIRMVQLEAIDSRGVESSTWWNALSFDCTVEGQSGLRDLERRLTQTCSVTMDEILKENSQIKPKSASDLVEFLQSCLQKGGRGAVPYQIAPESVKSILDRDLEAKRILDCIDAQNISLLEVTGLQEIGKSFAIRKALGQSGLGSTKIVHLGETPSVDFLIKSILTGSEGDSRSLNEDPLIAINSDSMIRALRSIRVLVIESAHHLLKRGAWRDATMPRVLKRLVEIASDLGITIIVETRRSLPLDLTNPALGAHLRVSGLDRQKLKFGISLFESQLRRNELSPHAISAGEKEFVISTLGGHPVAIALAADVMASEGRTDFLKALRSRKGFYLNYVSKLVRELGLSETENQILQVLGLSREPVPRDAIFPVFAIPINPILQDLILSGVVEQDEMGLVALAGILADHFEPRDLSDEQIQVFHETAARMFENLAERTPSNLSAAVEAVYHAGLAGVSTTISTELIDGALGTAEKLYENQEYPQARAIVKVLLKRKRSHDVLRLAALIEARSSNSNEALRITKEVLSTHPNDTWLLSELTKIALTQYQADELAEELIAIARKAGVEDVNILVTEGRFLLRKGRLLEAENACEKAVEKTERNPWPFYYLGNVRIRLGKLDKALEILLQGEQFCYRKNTRNRGAYNAIRTKLGLAYLLLGETEAAAQVVDLLIEETPTRPEVIRLHAMATATKDGPGKAYELLQKLNPDTIKSRNERCEFHLFMGLNHLQAGNNSEALEHFFKAHKADRSNVFVMMKWARTHFEMGNSLLSSDSEAYKYHFDQCADIVRQILSFDRDNAEGIELFHHLHDLGVSV
jgi:tetratricopeptide (TPR) repeat protein